MAVPKVLGTEIEYGVIVPNDPNFDPISVSLLLVNSYHGEPQRRLLWDHMCPRKPAGRLRAAPAAP